MALIAIACPPAALAAPYMPADDDEVLITIRGFSGTDASTLTAAQMLATTDTVLPDSERLAKARGFLELALSGGNETAFQLARAMLTRWWNEPVAEIPVDAAFMQALIQQHYHDFESALGALNAVLSQQPRHAQAQLVRAQIYLASGRYTEARADCEALMRYTASALAASCVGQAYGLSGDAERSYTALHAMLQQSSHLTNAERAELELTLASIAHRTARTDEAELLYQRVLEQAPRNAYALLNYADLLVEQQRFPDVMRLFDAMPADERNLEMIARLEEAARQLARPEAGTYLAYLQDSFVLARRRGDSFPHKELAYHLLAQNKEPQEALSSARANWDLQKEPSDLLLLVRAALAARDRAVLAEAADWLRSSKLEDVRIRQLLATEGVLP